MREIEKENCLNFKMSFKSQSRSDHINKLFNMIDTRFIYFYLFKPCIDHIEKYYPKEKNKHFNWKTFLFPYICIMNMGVPLKSI